MSKNDTDEFQRIDKCLESYHNQYSHYNYPKKHGISRFIEYIIDEQLNDPDIPIESELGLDCDPTECAYTELWMDKDTNSPFPVPSNIQIPPGRMEEYIFYILQYCYKNNTSPPTQYIIDNILPKVDGTSNDQLQNDYGTSTAYIHSTDNENHQYDDIKEDKDIPVRIKLVSKKEFVSKYQPRAHLNIYITKELTESLLHRIAERFNDSVHLYYYIDMSTGLQMNDHQVQEYTILINGEQHKFGIVNYDLHCKTRPNQILYGIFVPNKDHEIKQDKWLWKLDKFLTPQEILNKYDIKSSKLPKSSRKMDKFQKQLHHKLVINEELIDNTDWLSVDQIKSVKRNKKIKKESVTLNKKIWIKECKKSLQNNNLPLIPVVINRNNNHWIEWIKIIYVESQNFYVGISCKYMKDNKEWKVQSICLDGGDIYNKHCLVGSIDNKYIEQLKDLKFSKTKIIFNDNDDNDDNDSDEKTNTNQLNKLDHKNMISLIQKEFKPMIYRTKWALITVYNSINNGIQYKLCIRTKEFKRILLIESNKKSNDNKNNIILIGVHDCNGKYHVEYLKIIRISNNSIGISFKPGSRKNTTKVAAIYSNKERIKERHKLLCSNDCSCLDNFVSNIDGLQIGDPNKLNIVLNQLQMGHMKLVEFVEYIIYLIEGIQDSNIDIKSLMQILNTAKKMINTEENQSVNTNITIYIQTLEDIQYFYYQQGVNSPNQPIQLHPIHQQIQQLLKYSTISMKHNSFNK